MLGKVAPFVFEVSWMKCRGLLGLASHRLPATGNQYDKAIEIEEEGVGNKAKCQPSVKNADIYRRPRRLT